MRKKKKIMEENKIQEQNNQAELSNEQKESQQNGTETQETLKQEEESAVQFDLLEKQIKELEEKISELEKNNSELKDAFLRKAAEFENYKRRTENDQLNIIKYAAEPFIKSILTVYDDLERSLTHINGDNNFESLKKGLELIYDNSQKF